MKRLFDIFVAAVALLLLWPCILALALWVRLDSPGRIFFRQRRVGLNQDSFRIVKFRTMEERDPDSIDQHAEVVVSEGVDPRITRSGRFLRATSLDELPQLWNVLIGDMSLVGPRPVLPEQVEAMPIGYLKRFSVRPGLTGLAQVRGRRGLSWLQQLQADEEYVDKQSLFLDLLILLRTPYVLLCGSGIYGGEAQNWRAYRDEMRAQQRETRP